MRLEDAAVKVLLWSSNLLVDSGSKSSHLDRGGSINTFPEDDSCWNYNKFNFAFVTMPFL